MKVNKTNLRHTFRPSRWLVAVVMLCCIILSSAAAQTKGNGVTLDFKQTPLEQVLKSIEKQTSYKFIYDKSQIKDQTPVTIKVTDVAMPGVLDKVLNGMNLTYTVQGKQVVITVKKNLKPDKNNYISGNVTDVAGEPLVGVSVINTTNGAAVITDVDGNFAIKGKEGDKIQFSYVGFKPELITVNKTKFDIILSDDQVLMDEVVVVGYGTQKKTNLTGAVTAVDKDVFERRPAANIARMLEGAVPGLNISIADPKPLRSAEFNVRGMTSINGGSALVLIDGVEGDPALLNPDDIENVSVLKDAA